MQKQQKNTYVSMDPNYHESDNITFSVHTEEPAIHQFLSVQDFSLGHWVDLWHENKALCAFARPDPFPGYRHGGQRE
jgi:hypothetical protein